MFDPLSRPGAQDGGDTWFSDRENARKAADADLAVRAFGEREATKDTKAEFKSAYLANKAAYEARKRAAQSSQRGGIFGAIGGAIGTAVGGPIGGAIGGGLGSLFG